MPFPFEPDMAVSLRVVSRSMLRLDSLRAAYAAQEARMRAHFKIDPMDSRAGARADSGVVSADATRLVQIFVKSASVLLYFSQFTCERKNQ